MHTLNMLVGVQTTHNNREITLLIMVEIQPLIN
jgi:hypothetical protein